nr:hypothetical protein [Rhodopirellula sp. JC737]
MPRPRTVIASITTIPIAKESTRNALLGDADSVVELAVDIENA